MTITIADGRGALWQWDAGRRVKVTDGNGVKQIHYQNKCFGRSVDVDVGADGTAIIPDELLQDYHTLTAYAYATDDTGAYTMVQQDFAVYKRAKPADYVYTPTEHAGFDKLQRQIGDLADLTTEEKTNLVAAINEAAESGGSSPDAVLYTPQTLTDAQKKQARENVDAASSDFVVNGTLYSSGFVSLDKTFTQVQAAIQEGKQPVAKLPYGAVTALLPLVGVKENQFIFGTTATAGDQNGIATLLLSSNDEATFDASFSPVLDADGYLPQISMGAAPTSDMQIATKKYVDDKEFILRSTTPNSTKKFKITVDDTGALTATEVTE